MNIKSSLIYLLEKFTYMSQQVKEINVRDLVLWTENPRHTINIYPADQDIVDRALDDKLSKWTLSALAKEMGDFYDFSELPTVVFHGKKPIVYDGNRRMIIAKLKHKLVDFKGSDKFALPNIPEEIPCNVCSRDVALKNVYRKHINSGSWQPLERDMFLNKFMKEDKSIFLILEESTGLISANPHLNQRFVKEEVFKENILLDMGFEIKGNKLVSVHSDKEALSIFSDISKKIANKTLSTRNNRHKVIQMLEKGSQRLIDKNKDNDFHPIKVDFEVEKQKDQVPRQTRRTNKKSLELFGGKLILQPGNVNSLYRDIADLFDFYTKNKSMLSDSFPSLIRMALRLLSESASGDTKSKGMEQFLKDNFAVAKKNLDQDTKTTLAAQNVTDGSIVQLLHTGAHNYHSANNLDQTIAISIILGEILKITHGKN